MSEDPLFILRVREDSGFLISDDRHQYGGTDVVQSAAFCHLIPSGSLAWGWRDVLFRLAELHQWEVRITESDSAER